MNKNIKSWLIITSPPICGIQNYYCAFSKDNPHNIQKITDWFWNEETVNFWEDYARLMDYEEAYEDDNEDCDSFEEYLDYKEYEWRNDCNLHVEEKSIIELSSYGYEGNLPEILYDERKNDTADS